LKLASSTTKGASDYPRETLALRFNLTES